MAEQLKLSVVDQCPVRMGSSAGEALRESIALAQAVERFGYARFWVAEHHNMPSLAATSPEILIGQIAAHTDSIRVGSGGVMLLHYSALKVAENFRMLESLYPSRIDLGLGRAPGGDQRTAAALAYPAPMRDARHYPELVDDLVSFLADDFDASHPFAGLRAAPTASGVPDVWLLGSAAGSAQLAAERGLPFSYAHFFGAGVEQGPAIVESYRRMFKPSAQNPQPRTNVALAVFCAESDEEVAYHTSSLKLSRLNMARGRPMGIVPPDEALAHRFTPEEVAFLERSGMNSIQGTPGAVRAQLEHISQEFQTQDLSVVTICYSFEARVASYELLARSCGLTPRTSHSA